MLILIITWLCQETIDFWDPLGFTSDGDLLAFKRREVELKHGTIAMLASMGYITPKLVDNFPGYCPSLGLKYADVPQGVGKDLIYI